MDRDFSFGHHYVQTGSGTHLTSYSMGISGYTERWRGAQLRTETT